MVWYLVSVYIINRTLHGLLEIRSFSSRVEIFFNTSREISIKLIRISDLYYSPWGSVAAWWAHQTCNLIRDHGFRVPALDFGQIYLFRLFLLFCHFRVFLSDDWLSKGICMFWVSVSVCCFAISCKSKKN